MSSTYYVSILVYLIAGHVMCIDAIADIQGPGMSADIRCGGCVCGRGLEEEVQVTHELLLCSQGIATAYCKC